jgi:hypothetical protein
MVASVKDVDPVDVPGVVAFPLPAPAAGAGVGMVDPGVAVRVIISVIVRIFGNAKILAAPVRRRRVVERCIL